MTNQVRVFLSSTFRDFARERELVHTEVVPTLDEMCRHFGLLFELSDLRWGLPPGTSIRIAPWPSVLRR
jgi:hypothetical protein